MRSIPRRLTAITALAVTVLLGGAAPAYAHARVVSTSPSQGSTVTGDVSRIVVRFDDVVTLVPHALTVTTDVGQPVGLESPRVIAGRTLTAFVQDHLAPGRYAVAWRIMAGDGHIESATFTFAVAGAGGRVQPASTMAASGPPAAPGEPVWPVLVAAGVAAAAGLGAAVAVRRGLAVAAMASTYPPGDGPEAAHVTSGEGRMLRLPM